MLCEPADTVLWQREQAQHVPRIHRNWHAGIVAYYAATEQPRRLPRALERSDVPDAWQLPQGGLNLGEEPAQAAFREIEEETGLPRASLEPIRSFPELLAYELPPKLRSKKTGRGQVQYWFFFRLNKGAAEPHLPHGGEFRDWKWMQFPDLVKRTVDFRRPLYVRLAEYFEREIREQVSE